LERIGYKHFQGCLIAGALCMELERFTEASGYFARSLQINSESDVALANLGAALYREGKIDQAKIMLEYALELDPKNLFARLNLGGVLQALGKRQENLSNALEAVSIDPTSSLAFNNLGTALTDLEMRSEALHAFQTARILDPKSVDVLINLGMAEAHRENFSGAIECYDQALELVPLEQPDRRNAIRFFRSFLFLQRGQLLDGWEGYEGGFSPLVPITGRRAPARNFPVPRWSGDAQPGKTLLVWREQGLGDEIMFGTCLIDLLASGMNIIFECEHRMVPVWARTYPEFIVRNAIHLQDGSPLLVDYDLEIPLGSLPRLFRGKIEAFEASPRRHLVPDPVLVSEMRDWLKAVTGERTSVGICWRSGMIDPNRAKEYSHLIDWSVLLSNKDLAIVNLQYGECEAELLESEQQYGIAILRPPLDLKNDLERLAALMSCLDVVFSAHTAVLQMAGHLGVRTVSIDPEERFDWPYLGVSSYPWYAKCQTRILKRNLACREQFLKIVSG